MASVEDYTDPHIETFVPVPPTQPGVCDVCHGASNPGFSRCRSCHITTEQVSKPLTRIVPIALCEAHGQFHHVLRSYKDGTPKLQDRLRLQVAAFLGRFLAAHGSCIGQWDAVTTVPSGHGRPGGHPLARALQLVAALKRRHIELLEPGQAATPDRHLDAADDRFQVVRTVDGLRVLLIDDMLTTSAAVQSAASALSLAGAHVPAACVLGRYIKPDYSEATTRLWERAVARKPFRFGRCCLCDPLWP